MLIILRVYCRNITIFYSQSFPKKKKVLIVDLKRRLTPCWPLERIHVQGTSAGRHVPASMGWSVSSTVNGFAARFFFLRAHCRIRYGKGLASDVTVDRAN